MWKFLKVIGHLLRGLFWLVFILFLAGVVALYFLERGLPLSLLRRIEAAASTDDLHVRIERASFSLKNGVRLFRVKALPKRVADNALASADELALDIALAPGLDLGERLRGVTVKGLSMPALPPKRPRDEPPGPEPSFPALASVPLTLENADILGIRADRLTATVSTSAKRIRVTDIAIHLPDPAERPSRAADGDRAAAPHDLRVAGEVTVDLAARRVSGTAKGRAFPENLLPLFSVLKARGAVRQIVCFSKIARPVDAAYTFDVDIDTTDFAMRLDLDVGPCAYRDVPMAYARGTLGIYGTNIHTTVVIDPLETRTAAGAPLSGRLAYREETEGLEVEAATTMDTKPLFDILNILNHGELDRIRCAAPPTLSVGGAVALSSTESTITNDLTGTVALPAGTILNFEAKDATADFALSGHSARFLNVAGSSRTGGKLTGDIAFLFPGYAATATVFTANIRLHDVPLEDISQAFSATNDRSGLVSGTLVLAGPTHGRTVDHLSGEGHIRIHKGDLNRIKLFAGLTDYLSRNVPGISALVDQSNGSMDFTIEDGVLKTDNLLIEGKVFSITGRGTYDIAADKLDFTVRANVFKQKTLLGKVTRIVTIPFSRLLLEFKVFGSLDAPDWSYVNIIEKVTDALTP
jgi:hypothetical protein